MSKRYQIVIKAGEHIDWEEVAIALDQKTKEVLEAVSCLDCKTQDTVICGPTLRIPDFEVKKEATGADSIREGIDAEILQMMMNKSLVEEETAIIDDLKHQMEAGVIMPQVYVMTEIKHIQCKSKWCSDLPDEPGPCSSFVLCTCGWPAAAEKHCKTCQHQDSCHQKKEEDK